MEQQIKCPVCGKPGIPDFRHENVVCPQCGSDLSIFRDINELKEKAGNTASPSSSRWKKTAITAGAVALLTTGANFIPRAGNGTAVVSNDDSLKVQNDSLKSEVQELKDSIVVIMNQKRPSDTKVTDGELYTVQKGDCLWTIAQQLYGDGSRCFELARLNNLSVNSVLQVGDKLKY